MKKYSLAVCSLCLPSAAVQTLSAMCGTVVPLPPDTLLDKPVSTHPDMLLAVIGETVFCHRSYLEKNRAALDLICKASGLSLVASDYARGSKYPSDVGFNVLPVGEYLFCRESSTAPEILAEAKAHGMKTVNVNQGYTACSCLSGRDYIITADKSVYKAAEGRCDALLISEGHISLPPYDTGFIGGVCAVAPTDAYTVGNIENHPDGERIKDFLSRHGVKISPLSDGELADFGGIKLFI